MAGILNHVILGSLGVIVGLVGVFFGYGVFRLILPILGFFLGYIFGSSLVESQLWGFMLGALFALVLAVLSYFYWSLLITIGGAIIGFGLGFAMGEWIGWAWLAWTLGIALALLFAVLWFVFKDVMVMFYTAMAGAGVVMAGLAWFWPWLFGWMGNQGIVATILTIILGLIGFAVQFLLFSALHLYSEPPKGGPPYVYIAN